MKLFDPMRKRINDLPELLGRRFAAPRLNIFPSEVEGSVLVSAMIPDDRTGRYTSRQVLRVVPDTKLAELLTAYRNDPETTLETLFEITLAPLAEPTDADLARDLRRAGRQETRPPRAPNLDAAIASIEL